MELIKNLNKREFIHGIKSAKGIAIAFIPFGMTLGLIGKSFNVDNIIIISMTFLIYSGASQTLLLKLFSNGNFDVVSAVFAAAMLNFRYVLINIPVYNLIENASKTTKSILGIILTDETVAFLTLLKNKSYSFALGVNLIGYISFSLSVILGVFLGRIFPTLIINSMKFVLYGTFLSLFISCLMVDIKNFKIALIAITLKIIFLIKPFNQVADSIEIVLILFLTSLIYAIISIGDKNVN